MSGGILITPELVVRCIAETWNVWAAGSAVRQAQVICVLRAAGFIDGPDLSTASLMNAAARLSAERMTNAMGIVAELAG